jgi:hypothetical protein
MDETKQMHIHEYFNTYCYNIVIIVMYYYNLTKK